MVEASPEMLLGVKVCRKNDMPPWMLRVQTPTNEIKRSGKSEKNKEFMKIEVSAIRLHHQYCSTNAVYNLCSFSRIYYRSSESEFDWKHPTIWPWVFFSLMNDCLLKRNELTVLNQIENLQKQNAMSRIKILFLHKVRLFTFWQKSVHMCMRISTYLKLRIVFWSFIFICREWCKR